MSKFSANIKSGSFSSIFSTSPLATSNIALSTTMLANLKFKAPLCLVPSISVENYTIVQIKKNIAEYLAGNLPDTAPQPNWDGTIEKVAAIQKPKPPVEVNQQPQQNQEMQNEFDGKDKQPDGEKLGPPPSPGMPSSGKKG